MGGKDDDSRSDLDKWLDTQRVEVDKIRQQFQDNIEKELRSWNDTSSFPSPSSSRGPFERFKSFIDTNFHTVSQGFRNFPSNVSELKARMQREREARREEELDIWRRWTGSDDSPDHIRMQIERVPGDEKQEVKEWTYKLLRESYERNKHVPAQKIIDLYRDKEWKFGALDQFATPMLSFGGACYYKSETVDNLPSTARWGWPAAKPQWLSVDWFRRSPYSPVRLEAHPELGEFGPYWRAAFEDLLSAALDKPMVSEEKVGVRAPYGKPQSTFYGPGLEWMLSLQCRGILPPQLPSLYKPVSFFDGFDEVKRPRTVEFMHDMDLITAADKFTRIYPLVKRDLNLLMDEVAIKSGPETQAEPLKVDLQCPWRFPETEEDLYDEMPPYTDLVAERPKDYPSGNLQMPDYSELVSRSSATKLERFTRWLEWEQVVGSAYATAHSGQDPKIAQRRLEAYLDKYGDTESFAHGFLNAWEEMEFPVDNSTHDMRHLLYEASVYNTSLYIDTLKAFQGNEKELTRLINQRSDQKEEYSPVMGKDLHQPPNAVWREESPTASGRVSQESEEDMMKKSEILSQLATTQTTRMPDGTVTTKVVLKRRFADGKEETHESVHTDRGEGSLTTEPKNNESGEAPKKKGWFWN